ncbi:MAG: DUF481 domain-containing protein [Pseudomonadota bacterium]|nr:DUF481 domain-containing protein [Pseudomonadota bacterium]
MSARFAAALAVFTVFACRASAQDGPPEVARAMLDAAAATGQTTQVNAVANAARAVFPDDAEAIDAYADGLTSALLLQMLNATSDYLVVKAAAEPEKAAPKVDDSIDEQELPSGEPPKWLKLGPWAGKATASGLVSSGNSRNAAAGLRVDAHREFSYFTHNISLYFDYGKSKGVKSQQRWGTAYKLDYLLGDNTYAYGRFSYDEDEFSGFDYKLFGGVGVGHRFFDTKEFKLKVEGGPGYQYSPIDDTREVDKHAAFYASGELDWIIRPGLKFEQDVNTTWTQPSSSLISSTALTTSLTDTLSAGVSFLYRYETDPPAGRVNTDTSFRMNLTYGF